MAGICIPLLIGLCTKLSNQINGDPKVLELKDDTIKTLFGDHTDVPPVIVVYDRKHKKTSYMLIKHIPQKVRV